MAEPPPFVCPICKRVSCHPRDAEMRFCAKCGLVDDVLAEWKLRALIVAEKTGTAGADDKPAAEAGDG